MENVWTYRDSNEKTSGKAPMDYYCETQPKAKVYRGRKRKTLPVVIDEDIKRLANNDI